MNPTTKMSKKKTRRQKKLPESSIDQWSCSTPAVVEDCGIFRLTRLDASSVKRRNPRPYYVLDCPDWVNIIPITFDRKVVFIRQFRVGTRSITLEIPGGMLDRRDEDPAEAARRELIEETGYDGETIELLGKIHPNPAIQTNLCYTYLARNAAPSRKKLSPDEDEELQVVLVPIEEVFERIRAKEITHALVIVAFVWLFGLGSSWMDEK